MGIKTENVSKRFGDFQALQDINLEIQTGSLVALLGPSGSGKSTLLRLIAGLDQADTGRIWLTGRDATHQSIQDRRVGFVFQHYALFKHLTIRKNIAFGLEINRWPQQRIQNRVEELLDLVQLRGLGDRYPSQLSGGQRQRVALARALAVEPKVLLLDEPFGALDANVRKDLRNWLRHLHDEVHVTTVFVTHDQEEAMEIADTIVVMNQGQIEQVGPPAKIYDQPATPFVMRFIGPVNILPSTSRLLRNEDLYTSHGQLFCRPHDIDISLTDNGDRVSAVVARITYLGWLVQIDLNLEDGFSCTAYLTRDRQQELELRSLQTVYIQSRDVRAFPLLKSA